MNRRPGTRVIEEIDHGTRTVNGTPVQITELVWNGHAGSSFEVYRVDPDGQLGDLLTGYISLSAAEAIADQMDIEMGHKLNDYNEH
jgi:hypothetical protein